MSQVIFEIVGKNLCVYLLIYQYWHCLILSFDGRALLNSWLRISDSLKYGLACCSLISQKRVIMTQYFEMGKVLSLSMSFSNFSVMFSLRSKSTLKCKKHEQSFIIPWGKTTAVWKWKLMICDEDTIRNTNLEPNKWSTWRFHYVASVRLRQ